MAYLLDGIILLLFGWMIFLGHRNGFIKTIAGVASFVLALALSAVLSGPVAGVAYATLVEPAVVETLDEQLGDSSPAATQLDAALEKMPAFVTNQLSANGIDSGAAMLKHFSGTDSGESVSESLTRQVVKPVVMPLLEAICALLLFIVLKLIISILFNVLNLLTKLPLLKQINKSLGVVAGIVQGILWAFFAVTVLQLLASAGLFAWLSTDLLDSTLVINWLGSVNPMTSTVRELVFGA